MTSCDDGWVSTVDARSRRELSPVEWWMGFRRKMAANTRSLTLSVSAQYRIKLAKPWELSPTPWKKTQHFVISWSVKWWQPYLFIKVNELMTNGTWWVTVLCVIHYFFMPLVSHVNLFHTENTSIIHISYNHLLLWHNMFRCTRRIFKNPRPGAKFST